jgi:thiol-disulfide isomerase/thioredoxin
LNVKHIRAGRIPGPDLFTGEPAFLTGKFGLSASYIYLYSFSAFSMRFLILPFILILSLASPGQGAPASYSIKGFLPYWKGAAFTLSVDGQPIHALTLEQDVYSYTGQVTRAQTGMLEIKEAGKPRFLPFFVEPGVIRIRDKGNKKLEVYGTPTNDAFAALNHRFDSLVLNGSGGAGKELLTKKSLAKEFIRSHPHSIISLQLLYDYFFLNNSVDDTAYAALFGVLDVPLKETTLGRKMGKEVAASSLAATGIKAIAMELPDSTGALRPVYTPGQYTLVHFWASWCVPCRKELPELLAVHQRYASLGFAMTGVSLDRNVQLWRRAAVRMSWKQLIDVGAFSGQAARNYGVKVVPTNLLLDREGTIIAKNLNMPELEKKLIELLGAKTF